MDKLLTSLAKSSTEQPVELSTSDGPTFADVVSEKEKEDKAAQQTVINYFEVLRPFWWLYLSLLLLLALMILYVKKDVIIERCRKKDPRDQITRLDVSSCNVEILVTCRPPPSYDQAMGLAPQEPPPHELPPKHPPLPEDAKMAETFNVWFG